MTGEYAGQTAVLYARVSTDDKGQDTVAQIAVMEEYCRNEGITIVGRFIDEKSGKDINRPQFLDMIARLSKGYFASKYVEPDPDHPAPFDPDTCKVDLLIAWNISRISRDQRDYMNIQHQVEQFGCHIRFVNESTKPETMEGQLIATIGAWQAEQERKKISENTKMALRQRKAAGKHNSRPMRIVFQEDIDAGLYKAEGLLRFDDNVKHKTKITTMPEVLAWASEGLSLRAIALTKLYVPQSTFYELLKATGRLEAVKAAYECSARVVIGKGKEE